MPGKKISPAKSKSKTQPLKGKSKNRPSPGKSKEISSKGRAKSKDGKMAKNTKSGKKTPVPQKSKTDRKKTPKGNKVAGQGSKKSKSQSKLTTDKSSKSKLGSKVKLKDNKSKSKKKKSVSPGPKGKKKPPSSEPSKSKPKKPSSPKPGSKERQSSSKPGRGSSKPGRGSSKPGRGSSKPGRGSSKPGRGSSKPVRGSSKPGSKPNTPGSSKPGSKPNTPGSSKPGSRAKLPDSNGKSPTKQVTSNIKQIGNKPSKQDKRHSSGSRKKPAGSASPQQWPSPEPISADNTLDLQTPIDMMPPGDTRREPKLPIKKKGPLPEQPVQLKKKGPLPGGRQPGPSASAKLPPVPPVPSSPGPASQRGSGIKRAGRQTPAPQFKQPKQPTAGKDRHSKQSPSPSRPESASPVLPPSSPGSLSPPRPMSLPPSRPASASPSSPGLRPAQPISRTSSDSCRSSPMPNQSPKLSADLPAGSVEHPSRKSKPSSSSSRQLEKSPSPSPGRRSSKELPAGKVTTITENAAAALLRGEEEIDPSIPLLEDMGWGSEIDMIPEIEQVEEYVNVEPEEALDSFKWKPTYDTLTTVHRVLSGQGGMSEKTNSILHALIILSKPLDQHKKDTDTFSALEAKFSRMDKNEFSRLRRIIGKVDMKESELLEYMERKYLAAAEDRHSSGVSGRAKSGTQEREQFTRNKSEDKESSSSKRPGAKEAGRARPSKHAEKLSSPLPLDFDDEDNEDLFPFN